MASRSSLTQSTFADIIHCLAGCSVLHFALCGALTLEWSTRRHLLEEFVVSHLHIIVNFVVVSCLKIPQRLFLQLDLHLGRPQQAWDTFALALL